MWTLRLFPAGTKIEFINPHRLWFALSAALMALSIGFFLVRGLNFGIDFRGGILIEARTQGPADLGEMRARLTGLGLGEVALQEFGTPRDVLIRVQRQEGDEKAQIRAIRIVKEALGEDVDYRRTEFVGPKVGAELVRAGVTAVVLAVLAIMVYIWFRFEWQFSLGAVVALAHDVLSTIGIFAALQLEFNLSTLAAILTIAGYSINDTVVVYDRVRENMRKYKKMPFSELLNRSNNDTLSRTLMTSVTTLLALFALFIFGGQVIRGFSFAMIWGVVIGTYSSICLAVPLLLYMNLRRGAPGDVGQPKAAVADQAP